MSGLTILILSLVLFLLQGSFFPFLFGGYSQPDLWLTVIALSSLMMDRRTAWTLALAGGFIQDVMISNSFGMHMLPYLVITLVFTKFGRQRYNRHWYISLVAVLFATLDYRVLSSIMVWWAMGHHPAPSYVVGMAMPLLFLNGIAAIFFHHILWHLRKEGGTLW